MIKKIFIILLVIFILLIAGKYGYYKYMSSLNFEIEEKLVVQFYNDDNNYLIDLNDYKGNKLY